MSSRHVLAPVLLILLAVIATAQKPTVKQVPCPKTSPTSGQEMYVAYCTSCHGMDGRGGGPAAAALKVPPADLTTLARRSNGKFPADHVYQVIRGGESIPAHGARDMPMMSDAHPSQVQMRLANLTKYVESLQEE